MLRSFAFVCFEGFERFAKKKMLKMKNLASLLSGYILNHLTFIASICLVFKFINTNQTGNITKLTHKLLTFYLIL